MVVVRGVVVEVLVAREALVGVRGMVFLVGTGRALLASLQAVVVVMGPRKVARTATRNAEAHTNLNQGALS